MTASIDVFNHIMPARYFERFIDVMPEKGLGKRMASVKLLHDIDARLRMMDQWPGYQQVLAPAPPGVEAIAGPNLSPELARMCNDGLAEICARWPDRFPAFIACIPFNNPAAALAEIDRAITGLGACGIQMMTHINGRALDDPEFFPFFERMANHHDLPIFLHPLRSPTIPDYPTETKSKFEIWQVLDWPHDTSVAMARIVFSGMLEKLPKIKIITHHLGGTVPYLEGRVGPLWDQLGARTADENYDELRKSMTKRPVDYFRMFYGDTVVGGSKAALQCGLSFFGADHVLFASDCPFDPEGGPMFIRENLRGIEELDISDADREKILSGNARKMLRLKAN